jgi:hypothetical protein
MAFTCLTVVFLFTEAAGAEESVNEGADADVLISPNQNSTDEEKLLSQACDTEFSLANRFVILNSPWQIWL